MSLKHVTYAKYSNLIKHKFKVCKNTLSIQIHLGSNHGLKQLNFIIFYYFIYPPEHLSGQFPGYSPILRRLALNSICILPSFVSDASQTSNALYFRNLEFWTNRNTTMIIIYTVCPNCPKHRQFILQQPHEILEMKLTYLMTQTHTVWLQNTCT